jgi:polyphosphate kinase 2 (PPK2 family)
MRLSSKDRARFAAWSAPFKVVRGRKFRLRDYDPGDTLHLESSDKSRAQEGLRRSIECLSALQDRLYAQDRWSVLLIFQAMDAAGKDGAIEHVFSGVNPQGCQVTSFKAPSSEELDHDYLWRCSRALPERGRIGVFNRSYYEEVLVVRVHEEILAAQKAARQPRRQEALAAALRGHRQLRAVPRTEWHADPQVLPEPVARRAEEALSRAHRRPGQELEVRAWRRTRTRPLGGVHERL